MECCTVSKHFWFGVFNASMMSIPLWALLYWCVRLVF